MDLDEDNNPTIVVRVDHPMATAKHAGAFATVEDAVAAFDECDEAKALSIASSILKQLDEWGQPDGYDDEEEDA
jgi:hypothetical protein